jgi:hypothetical protein
MKLHKINKINNFISGFYIDKSICKKLIDIFEKNKKLTEPGKTIKGNEKVIEREIKASTDLCITPSPIYEFYLVELQKCLNEYIKQYSYVNSLPSFRIVEDFNIQRYKKNEGFFKYHFERGGVSTMKRILVFMTYLNTVKDGGETEFLYQKTKVKAEEGLTLIWPSDWTHTHRGITSKSENKYIVTGWYSVT